MDSYSGIVFEEATENEHFTDFTPIPCRGFNTLFKAKRYGRWWILKGLKEPFRQQETYRNFLKKEFTILVSLQHPNIVTASSLENVAGYGYCIVMELIDGITLQEWIDNHTIKGKEELDTAAVAEGEMIFSQLLDAVGYIHAKQTVHRDLKPSNVMITHNGKHVKLIDFGLADTDSYAILKQPAGTPGYISPEQASSRQADIRNDIYSIGCILERMQLGGAYDAVINRCKCAIEKRYASIDEIKTAFITQKARSHKHRARILLVFFVCATLSAGVCYTFLHKNMSGNEYYDKTADGKSRTVHKTDSVTAKVYKPQAVSQHILQSSQTSTEAMTAQIISEGKKTIDKMWHDTGIDTLQSVVKKSESLYLFINKSNDYITTVYPKTFNKGITGSQKTYIINELSAYTTNRYIKPTTQSLQSGK